ncbi:MAG: exo-alpha-sialidase [Cyclobacteriaceae bacterium]|nr:exo-alpha-sialidase [Cyclobacteriaceae bacterium]
MSGLFSKATFMVFVKRKGVLFSLIISGMIFLASCSSKQEQSKAQTQDEGINYVIVSAEEGRFRAWPANNGLWNWDNGKEILVGFTDGKRVRDEFHFIEKPYISKLARSLDGGKTWNTEDPEGYVGDGKEVTESPGDITFNHPDFAMRVGAIGYHGNDDPLGLFFYSYDRGKSWAGPYRFTELNDAPELEGMEMTSRTSYLVDGEQTILIMMTARKPEWEFGRDKAFVARSKDGGKSFQFISWIVPLTDDYRAVMLSTVRLNENTIITTARRRNPFDAEQPCWVDAYISEDRGESWRFLSKVGETGLHNGNPPALTLLKDGRLVCVYANRDVSKMMMRYSEDQGKTWGEETVIRDNLWGEEATAKYNPNTFDMGYPQVLQNVDGNIVAIYYLAREERPHSYIEAAIWKP